MHKMFNVSKSGSEFYSDGYFFPEEFEQLAVAMNNNESYEFTYHANGGYEQSISYNSDNETLVFFDNCNTVFTINLFNGDNFNRRDQFANEFHKVKSFLNCLKGG